jgi:hypothetical protein
VARPLSALGTPSSRLGIGVAALAVVVYLGALANGFAWDDVAIVADNTLVHHASGLWRAFATPYWPAAMGGYLYRPLVVASYTLDWLVAPGRAWWFHGVNVVWHAGASVAVALLARRWAGDAAGWIAGALFAVHPVHVEAVANVIGRAELMAAVFSLLAVWLAIERDQLAAAAVAWALALLAKENAVVVPALVGAAWLLGFRRPPPRRMVMYAAAGCVVGVAYTLAREVVFGPYPVSSGLAIVFLDQSPLTVRLTAVAALADVARLLVFPLTLRADYSPNERTAVTAFGDPRFLAGLACIALWAALLWLSWRRHRRVETLGIAWIGIALAPVTNLLFPVGVLVAERTLYLPSVGLTLAAGSWLGTWWAGAGPRARRIAGAAIVATLVAGGLRTALRVPVWESTETVHASVLRDSPLSYFGAMVGARYAEREGRYADALEGFRRASRILPADTRLSLRAAELAYRLGRPLLADTLLAHIDSTCVHCQTFFEAAAIEARSRGELAWADALLRHFASLQATRAAAAGKR